jgi:N-acetylglutamate synthase-like GNAT family acetyltransferase
MAKAGGLIIKRAGKQKEIDEVRKFASMTGSEEDEIDEMIKHDKVYLAQKHGNTIGFLALRSMKNGEVAEISGLAIVESERRKGNAGLLVRHAEELARTVKAKRVIVRTSNDNIPTLALYQKVGFRIAEVKLGVLVEHHGTETSGWESIPVRDEIILEKSLS